MQAANRLRTRYDIDSKEVLLQINDVRPQDAGEYRLIATNPAGEDSTVGTLNVVPDKPGVDDRPIAPTDKLSKLERPRGQERRPLEVVPSAGTKEGVVQEEVRPPRVLAPLKDSNVEESMPVILTTKIDAGSPMGTVRFHFYLYF
jgi:hypothetical protein